MKNIYLLIIFLFLFLGCRTSKKYLQKGEYHTAVKLAVKKLQKNRTSKDDIEVLSIAYPQANQKDKDRINYLNTEGQANRWDEIYTIYSRLKNRQEYVKTILPISQGSNNLNLEMTNYDQKISDSKKKAAEYYHAHAKSLMLNSDKSANRKAYNELKRIKELFSSYKDTDRLLQIAREKGTSKAAIVLENNSRTNLPKQFYEEMLSLNTQKIDKFWVKYDVPTQNNQTKYDYDVVINLKAIYVSPEKMSDKTFREERTISDGWDYVLDQNGNVVKDSLGNDIKEERFITIYCDVLEQYQLKTARIEGKVEYYENATKKRLRSEPILSEHVFENVVIRTKGDMRALSPETKRRTGGVLVEFPPNIFMINEAGKTLKQIIQNVLVSNKRLLS